MNIQASKFNLLKCSPKANVNCSGLCTLPRKAGLFFYGMGCCVTQQDNKVSRTHHLSSDRETITSQTKINQYTGTHTFWVKAIHKGNIFNCLEIPNPDICHHDRTSLTLLCYFITWLIAFDYFDILHRNLNCDVLGGAA